MNNIKILLKRYSNLIAYLGLIILIIASGSYVVAQQVSASVQVLLIVGAAFLALYIAVESVQVRTSLTGRVARYGTNSLLMIAAFVGIMIMVNALAARHYARWDVTASQQYSISEQTINILEGLQEPVKVFGFFSTGNPYQMQAQMAVENLLKSYILHTDKLSYEFIDPDLKPGLARQYEITNYGTLAFVRGDKVQQTTAFDEQSLTSTLLKVSSDESKAIYFLTGHKERDIEGDDEWGYKTIKRYLEKDNYKVGTLNFTITDTIPSDMDVLVLASPQIALSEKEVGLIDSYLRNGGKALIMTDPSVPDPFGELLSRRGISFRDDLVIDPASSFPQDISTVVAMDYQFPEITKGVEGLIAFFPGVRSIEVAEDITDTLSASPVIQTTETSWGETGYQDEAKFGLEEGVDTKGPLTIALAVTSSADDMRLALFGNAEFVSNSAIINVQGAGNQDLFAGAVNWLAEEEDLVAISPKPPEQRLLMVPPGSSRLIIFSSLILLPLIVIIAGIIVWWKRR